MCEVKPPPANPEDVPPSQMDASLKPPEWRHPTVCVLPCWGFFTFAAEL